MRQHISTIVYDRYDEENVLLRNATCVYDSINSLINKNYHSDKIITMIEMFGEYNRTLHVYVKSKWFSVDFISVKRLNN